MSSIALSTTLPERSFTPLAGPLDHYERVALDLPREPEFDLDGKRTPMLLLPAVAMATLRYVAAPVRSMHPRQRGIVTESSLWLAHWGWQGGERSAFAIAKRLQAKYFPTGIDGYRRNGDPVSRIPRKGLALIAATDELGCEGLEWYCDVPTEADPYEFETVRLKTALARFER